MKKKAYHHLFVRYDYAEGDDAYFSFYGTAWQFVKVLYIIYKSHEVYEMRIMGSQIHRKTNFLKRKIEPDMALSKTDTTISSPA
jgi:hypothetical protein